jgi:hypothetical protein
LGARKPRLGMVIGYGSHRKVQKSLHEASPPGQIFALKFFLAGSSPGDPFLMPGWGVKKIVQWGGGRASYIRGGVPRPSGFRFRGGERGRRSGPGGGGAGAEVGSRQGAGQGVGSEGGGCGARCSVGLG